MKKLILLLIFVVVCGALIYNRHYFYHYDHNELRQYFGMAEEKIKAKFGSQFRGLDAVHMPIPNATPAEIAEFNRDMTSMAYSYSTMHGPLILRVNLNGKIHKIIYDGKPILSFRSFYGKTFEDVKTTFGEPTGGGSATIHPTRHQNIEEFKKNTTYGIVIYSTSYGNFSFGFNGNNVVHKITRNGKQVPPPYKPVTKSKPKTKPKPKPPAISPPIVAAARAQIGTTVHYDPAYVSLTYPGGDVPAGRGVCTDVIIRALRVACKMDLQKLIHEDMRANFSKYPANWGLKRPDRNIDHRRVPNLRCYFKRRGWSCKASQSASDYLPGDIVTCSIENLPHIMIVSDRKAHDGTPQMIHNIGRGTQEENALFTYKLTGHYRIPADQ